MKSVRSAELSYFRFFFLNFFLLIFLNYTRTLVCWPSMRSANAVRTDRLAIFVAAVRKGEQFVHKNEQHFRESTRENKGAKKNVSQSLKVFNYFVDVN